MLSRRALLGTLLGLPFAAQAVKATEIGDITITGIPGFNKQRIEDIGDAFLLSMEKSMDSRGIRFTDVINASGSASWGTAFIIPSEDAEKSILDIQRMWSSPGTETLIRELKDILDSKCRYYGVEIFRHEGGLFVQMSVSLDESNPTGSAVEAVYSKYLEAMPC